MTPHEHVYNYDTFLCRICGKSRKEILAVPLVGQDENFLFFKRIGEQHPCPPEYAKVVDKYFWDLVDGYQRGTPDFRSLTHLDSYIEPECGC